MATQIITSNSAKGENIFHCWNCTKSFYIFTQRGKRGMDAAYHDLNKQFPGIVLSITHCTYKEQIKAYYK